MSKVLEQIQKIGIVPVVKIDDAAKAVPLAKALMAGGIQTAEITFRTAEGEQAIANVSKEVPDILVGAGTVTTTDQVDRAIAAGAKFIVSPGLNPKIVEYCVSKGVPITPGCTSPSDIEKAIEFGLEIVKFFPAEQSGGLDFLKAVSAPYTKTRFMPTGGINQNNIGKYLAFDRIVACGGSWMVPPALINEDKFDEITRLCKEAVKTVLDFKLAHIGVNTENAEQAQKAASLVEFIFGMDSKVGNSSTFAGEYFEFNHAKGLGTNGHIAISTPQIDRAIYHLEAKGIEFNYDSIKKDNNGKTKAIYLKEEVAGFALHLVQKA